MRLYEKLNLLLTFAAFVAAAWIGYQQLNINNALLGLNYDPSLVISYTKPIAPDANGLQFTNNGKTKLFYYETVFIDNNNNPENKIFVDTSGENVIPPGGTIYQRDQVDIATQLIAHMGTSTDKTFPLDVFFKTADYKKYVLRTNLRLVYGNNQWSISWGPDTYGKYDWPEKAK